MEKKKVILGLIVSTLLFSGFAIPVNAGLVEDFENFFAGAPPPELQEENVTQTQQQTTASILDPGPPQYWAGSLVEFVITALGFQASTLAVNLIGWGIMIISIYVIILKLGFFVLIGGVIISVAGFLVLLL